MLKSKRWISVLLMLLALTTVAGVTLVAVAWLQQPDLVAVEKPGTAEDSLKPWKLVVKVPNTNRPKRALLTLNRHVPSSADGVGNKYHLETLKSVAITIDETTSEVYVAVRLDSSSRFDDDEKTETCLMDLSIANADGSVSDEDRIKLDGCPSGLSVMTRMTKLGKKRKINLVHFQAGIGISPPAHDVTLEFLSE